MKTSRAFQSSLLAAVAALAITAGTGCARTITLPVLRPAPINLVPEGNTVTVGHIAATLATGEAADGVTKHLQERIAGNDVGLRLLPSGGAVTVDGSILKDSYEEHEKRVSATCTTPGTNDTYDCSYTVTIGVATSRIRLRLVESGGDHRVFLDRVYEQSGSVTNPSQEGVVSLRRRLWAESADEFAVSFIPMHDTVTERFKDCDGDSACERGFEAVKKGDLAAAEALFSKVIAAWPEPSAIPAAQQKRVGEALYDRAVVRAHQRRYDEAADDLLLAIGLQPGRARWLDELDQIRRLARYTKELQAQGAQP